MVPLVLGTTIRRQHLPREALIVFWSCSSGFSWFQEGKWRLIVIICVVTNFSLKKGSTIRTERERTASQGSESTVPGGIQETEQLLLRMVNVVKRIQAPEAEWSQCCVKSPLNPDILALGDFTAILCSHWSQGRQEERRYKKVVKVWVCND